MKLKGLIIKQLYRGTRQQISEKSGCLDGHICKIILNHPARMIADLDIPIMRMDIPTCQVRCAFHEHTTTYPTALKKEIKNSLNDS